jgi:hypothetical protein
MAETEDLNRHRHLRAVKDAEAAFLDGFAKYPDECFMLRHSLPFQFPDWGPNGHLEHPYTIARISPCRTKITMHPLTDKQFPPDPEQVLFLLWKEFIDPGVEGSMLDYSQNRPPATESEE